MFHDGIGVRTHGRREDGQIVPTRDHLQEPIDVRPFADAVSGSMSVLRRGKPEVDDEGRVSGSTSGRLGTRLQLRGVDQRLV